MLSRRVDDGRLINAPHNFGIDILRVWMCFEVILCHFWVYNPPSDIWARIPLDILSQFREFAVPIFLFVSFLLCAKHLNNPNLTKQKLGERLRRLIIPILFWGIGYFVVMNLLSVISGRGFLLTFGDLALQLILGHVYNTPMWFMNVMLALTLTVVLINRILPKKYWLTANCIITVLSLCFCMSGLNYRCFGFLAFEYRYPLGRYFEMMPLVGMANILYLKGIKIFKVQTWIKSSIFLVICCIAGWLLQYVGWKYDTFDYASPGQYVFTIPFVILMCIIPFDRISGFLKVVFTPLAHYSLGIYCIHYAIGVMCNYICTKIGYPVDTLMGCMIIFLISYIICRLVALVPYRWARQAVS